MITPPPRLPWTRSGRYFVVKKSSSLHRSTMIGHSWRERPLLAGHPQTLCSVHNLAYVSNETGRYEQALALYARIFAEPQIPNTLGNHHRDTLSTLNNIGLAYDNLKSYNEARGLYMRARRGSREGNPRHSPRAIISPQSIKGMEASSCSERISASSKSTTCTLVRYEN